MPAIATPLNPTAMTAMTASGTLVNVLAASDGTLAVSGGVGGGGTSVDRELAVSFYKVKTGFTGASVGDVISEVQVLDVSATPSTVSVIWRNQTTSLDLGSAPTFSNLDLVGTTGPLAAQFPSSLGIKTAAASSSIAPASDAVFAVSITPATLANASGTVTTGGTAQNAAAANAARKGWFIQNLSTGDLWVNTLAVAIAGTPSMRISSGDYYETPVGAPGPALSAS